ncbi:MAG: hypothetical protein QXH46_03015 [Sulfolobales archaeon]
MTPPLNVVGLFAKIMLSQTTTVNVVRRYVRKHAYQYLLLLTPPAYSEW